MEKKNNIHLSNFWFGFVLGGAVILGLGYFFGTKKGREWLKKTLDFFDNFEENLELILKEIEGKEDKISLKKNSSPPSLLTSLTEKIRGLADKR